MANNNYLSSLKATIGAGIAAASLYSASPALAQSSGDALEQRVAIGFSVAAPGAMEKKDQYGKVETANWFNIGMTSYRTVNGEKVPIVISTPLEDAKSILTPTQMADLNAKRYTGNFEMDPKRENWTPLTIDQSRALLKAAGYTSPDGKDIPEKPLHPVRGLYPSQLFDGNPANFEATAAFVRLYQAPKGPK